MTSKLIRHTCLVVIVILLCVIIACESSLDSNNTIDEFRKLEILSDLPLKEDLEKYLIFLDKIVSFALKFKRYVNVNFAFGFFLTNINVKTVYSEKGPNLPENLRTLMANMIRKNSEILNYFHQMLDKYKVKTSTEEVLIRTAAIYFKKDQLWINSLKKYSLDLLKITNFNTKQAVLDFYGNWDEYVEKVFDLQSNVPNPEMSVKCIGLLSANVINSNRNCNASQPCVTSLVNGTNRGYGIIQRIIYLIAAQYGRGCSVLTSSQDKTLLDRFCATVYNEADYISMHGFKLVDLALENIALCSLEGHVQFLRRSWFHEFFNFQNILGCLGYRELKNKKVDAETIYKKEIPTWVLQQLRTVIMNGVCDTHTSAVASGAFSAVIRYMLEKYY